MQFFSKPLNIEGFKMKYRKEANELGQHTCCVIRGLQ